MTSASDPIAALEADLFETLPVTGEATAVAPIFIVGAPRTGSTIFYQALVSAFDLPFVNNLTNDRFPASPIVGLWLQAGHPGHESVSSTSRYGKVDGLWQPSEASAVMANWFGGGHPSELVSTAILPGQEQHFLQTMSACQQLLGRPLVTKNAWNCFRIEYLARALPNAAFIWIRRDIAAAAKSDLEARYTVQGDPLVWNSATPRNVEELRSRPYWEQVVENQFEFSRAIGGASKLLGNGRWCEVWYEDICADPRGALERVGRSCRSLREIECVPSRIPQIKAQSNVGGRLSPEDSERIDRFVEDNLDRFSDTRHSISTK